MLGDALGRVDILGRADGHTLGAALELLDGVIEGDLVGVLLGLPVNIELGGRHGALLGPSENTVLEERLCNTLGRHSDASLECLIVCPWTPSWEGGLVKHWVSSTAPWWEPHLDCLRTSRLEKAG